MAVYIVTGNLGGGKSLVCMGRARDYLWRGCRVATNVNVRVENLVSHRAPRDILRIPDHPTAEFLWNDLGYGSDDRDESKFGMLLIDEVGTWLNSRSWQGGDRQRVIEWFIHSRKRRWDCYLIAQSVNMIDRQVRDAIGEHVVFCRRLDRLGIPMIGPLLSAMGAAARMPQVHVAAVRYVAGMSVNTAPTVDRWFYRGRELYGSYDTSQRFDAANDGVATMLSPDRYPWLRKPNGFWFGVQEFLQRNGFRRLSDALGRVRRLDQAEIDYRCLQLMDTVPQSFFSRPLPTFSEWARSQNAGSYS
ncbi:MAG: hypothetical protein ING71_15725 [Rhodocyclaceae bacterium]|nr:hypothetical protein [Rhodocyclaceae bacterium]MCA3080227.1 hypothetical protein [Rhodocyclaceae bacterium]